jgi:hypothetical protein
VSTPDALPHLPDTLCNSGYDWLAVLAGGWYVVPSWSRDGWDLGSWPLVIIAHYDRTGCYGLAVYVEGDLDVTAYPTRAERDRTTDQQAAFHWRQFEHGPSDLSDIDDDLQPHHRGPHSRSCDQ